MANISLPVVVYTVVYTYTQSMETTEQIIAKAQHDQRNGVGLREGRSNILGATNATTYLRAYIASVATDPRALAASKA